MLKKIWQHSYFRWLVFLCLILVAYLAGSLSQRSSDLEKPQWLSNLGFINDLFGTETAGNKDSLTSTKTSPLGELIEKNKELSIPDIVEAASESVVTVSIKKQQVVNPFGNDVFGMFPFGFGQDQSQQSVEEVQRDIGTGFVVAEDDLVVTNKHVVSDPQAEYLVIDKDNVEYKVTRIYRDPTSDLAIVKADGLKKPALPLGDSDKTRVGESVIAIGTALGEFRHTVTTGVVSGLGRGITAGDGFSRVEELDGVIQTDAAINPGNSGGPLINSKGEVIGVNVAVSQAAQNIGFAIPINVIKVSVDNFNQTGQFERPFLGVRYQMITQKAALANEVPQGAYIVEVVSGSVADQAGIKPGDIITKIDGQSLQDKELAVILNKLKVGQKIELTWWQKGEEKKATVVLKAS